MIARGGSGGEVGSEPPVSGSPSSTGVPSGPLSSDDNVPFELSPLSAGASSITSAVLGDAAETAIFETFVVPGYLVPFAELALGALEPMHNARVAHLLSRTGFPDREIAQRLPGARIHGFDPSPYAVELATVKAASAFDVVAEYVCAGSLPSPLPEGVFTHALLLHPLAATPQRHALYGEVLRLLRPGGQLVFVLPVRGSFIEVFDLMREYGLKYELPEVDAIVARGVEFRPTVETFAVELEDAGFVDVDVELRPTSLSFRSARDFFESPATRLLVFPALHAKFDGDALDYLKDAISKYWSDADFEMSLNIACATAHKP